MDELHHLHVAHASPVAAVDTELPRPRLVRERTADRHVPSASKLQQGQQPPRAAKDAVRSS
jgi:hypothetical protein